MLYELFVCDCLVGVEESGTLGEGEGRVSSLEEEEMGTCRAS